MDLVGKHTSLFYGLSNESDFTKFVILVNMVTNFEMS